MSLPIRTFWLLNSNIGRIEAERDLRALTVQSASRGEENEQAVREHLTAEMGNVGKVKGESPLEAERDEAGFNELRSLVM